MCAFLPAFLCRLPGIDPSDFFNYQLNERGWKQYMERIKQYRLEFTMKVRAGGWGST